MCNLVKNKKTNEESLKVFVDYLNDALPQDEIEYDQVRVIRDLFYTNPNQSVYILLSDRGGEQKIAHYILWTNAYQILKYFDLIGHVILEWDNENFKYNIKVSTSTMAVPDKKAKPYTVNKGPKDSRDNRDNKDNRDNRDNRGKQANQGVKHKGKYTNKLTKQSLAADDFPPLYPKSKSKFESKKPESSEKDKPDNDSDDEKKSEPDVEPEPEPETEHESETDAEPEPESEPDAEPKGQEVDDELDFDSVLDASVVESKDVAKKDDEVKEVGEAKEDGSKKDDGTKLDVSSLLNKKYEYGKSWADD